MIYRLNSAKAFRVAIILLSAIFLILAIVFLISPTTGAQIYGLPTNAPDAVLFVRAIAMRDLALAGYLAGLTFGGCRRALTILLAMTTIIPLGDLCLLASFRAGNLVHYLLHGSSLLCFAGLAFWSRWLSSTSART
jgi:hypothetical protein